MSQRNLNQSTAHVQRLMAILECRFRSPHFNFISVLLSLFILIQGCATFRSSIPKSFEAEDRAYMQMDLDESRAILNCLLEDPNSSKDNKLRALQYLGIQDWLFYQDRNNAIKKLWKADSLDIKRCATWQKISRIERESNNFLEAREAARNALRFARGSTDTLNTQILLAHAIHDECVHCIKDSTPVKRNLLREASELLCSILEKEPGQCLPCQLLFGISLFLADGPTALKAWQAYFHLLPNDSIPGTLKESGRILYAVLPTWENRNLARNEEKQLILALAKSRFFDYAVLMLKVRLQREHGTSSISTDEQELLSYWEFLDQVKKLTVDFYHRTAIGGGKNGFFLTISSRFREDKYQLSLKEAFERLWKTLPWMGERPAFNDALFAKEVSRRFGFEYWLGNQNRYFGLLAGHRVFDTTHLISQYGFHSRVRYVSLDMMISNGYSSWFWDGRAMIGGTANDSIVYQFRPAYSGASYDMWEKVSDLARRAETEQKIQEGRLTDDSLAREKPYASLPSLALKLRYDGANRLLNSLKSKGIKESDLCLAFVSEWDRLVVESTVFGHEGRHLIDMQLLGAAYHDSLSPTDQEFNAKLSEVIFSFDAKIAFANLIHSYGGDASPHGQAEERIMKVVVKWIDEHKNEVAGFDPTKPTLPQFDLLTDDQIRRLFQLVDPLANRK